MTRPPSTSLFLDLIKKRGFLDQSKLSVKVTLTNTKKNKVILPTLLFF